MTLELIFLLPPSLPTPEVKATVEAQGKPSCLSHPFSDLRSECSSIERAHISGTPLSYDTPQTRFGIRGPLRLVKPSGNVTHGIFPERTCSGLRYLPKLPSANTNSPAHEHARTTGRALQSLGGAPRKRGRGTSAVLPREGRGGLTPSLPGGSWQPCNG